MRPEADPELAECVALRTDARSRLSALEQRERERTGIKGLKVKYASTFGYAIEVAKSHTGAVPPDYVRQQTLTTGERYVTPELKELELAISTAQSRQERLERQLFDALVERVAARADALSPRPARSRRSTCSARSRSAPAERGYVRPAFVDESVVAIDDGRHPVMESAASATLRPQRSARCASTSIASSC